MPITGLEARIDDFATSALSAYPSGPVQAGAVAIFGELSQMSTIAMLAGLADPTTVEIGWQLGAYQAEYDALVAAITATTDALAAEGEAARAEWGAALLDELGTGYDLAEDQGQVIPDIAADGKKAWGAIMLALKLLVAWEVLKIASDVSGTVRGSGGIGG